MNRPNRNDSKYETYSLDENIEFIMSCNTDGEKVDVKQYIEDLEKYCDELEEYIKKKHLSDFIDTYFEDI